ncbi:MAG TPA: sulfite exporter TauE/SafE family protein [Xanthobacteraceae bacterium]
MTFIRDPVFYLAAIPAVTFLGISKGGFAGVGLLATPLLALVLPPLQAAAILLPILLLQDVISVIAYRHDWDARNLKVMLPGAIVGIAAAWVLAAHVSDAHVRLVIGTIALGFVLHRWLGRHGAAVRRPTAPHGLFWGGVSGFTSTLCQAGSPPFQVHVMPQQLDKLTFVGTMTIFFAAVNVAKVVPYLALGQFSSAGLATSAALLPIAVVTNFIGIWLVRVTPAELFYRLSYLLIFIVALALIGGGLRDLAGS